MCKTVICYRGIFCNQLPTLSSFQFLVLSSIFPAGLVIKIFFFLICLNVLIFLYKKAYNHEH